MRPGDLTASELASWRAWQRQDPTIASPFLTPEFALAIDGARDDARVAVIEDLAANPQFLAFSVDGDAGAPIGVTICDAQAVIGPPEPELDARVLVRTVGLAAWRFDHLVSTQGPFIPFHTALHASPTVDLTRGHDAYLADVRQHSKDVLAQTARRRRKLGREVGDVEFTWSDPDPGALDTMLAWKSAQYRATGVWDRFEHPWIVDVVRALAGTESEGLTGITSTLRAGGELVAVHFGLLGRDRLCWWFPAYDPAHARSSPGLVLLLDLVEAAAARGLQLVDLGRGEHDYKLRVATGSYDVAEGVVPAATA